MAFSSNAVGHVTGYEWSKADDDFSLPQSIDKQVAVFDHDSAAQLVC